MDTILIAFGQISNVIYSFLVWAFTCHTFESLAVFIIVFLVIPFLRLISSVS